METMGLISLGVVGSILPDLVRSAGFTLHMGVEVLVAAALPLLHTKAGQRLQQSKIKKAQLNYFQWRLVQAATQESHFC
jgi:hypothetical protein